MEGQLKLRLQSLYSREKVVAVNRFKLNVQTNASCVDILVWAAREENGMRYMESLRSGSVGSETC